MASWGPSHNITGSLLLEGITFRTPCSCFFVIIFELEFLGLRPNAIFIGSDCLLCSLKWSPSLFVWFCSIGSSGLLWHSHMFSQIFFSRTCCLSEEETANRWNKKYWKTSQDELFLCLSLSLVQTPLQYSSVLTHPVFHCFVACYSLFLTAIAPTLMQRHMTCFIFYNFLLWSSWCLWFTLYIYPHNEFLLITNIIWNWEVHLLQRAVFFANMCTWHANMRNRDFCIGFLGPDYKIIAFKEL